MDKTVGRFGSRTEAEMARGLLVDAGIPARVRADDAGSLHPELGQVGSHSGITLVVPDEHVEEACEFLAAYAHESPQEEMPQDPQQAGSSQREPSARGRRGLRIVVVLAIVLMLGLAFGFDVFDVATGPR